MLLKIYTSNTYYNTLSYYIIIIPVSQFIHLEDAQTIPNNPKHSQNKILVVITVLHPRLVKFQNSVRGVDHFVLGTNCKILSMEKIWYKSTTKMASLESANS